MKILFHVKVWDLYTKLIFVYLFICSFVETQNVLVCPTTLENNKCSCKKLNSGIFLDCQESSTKDIKNILRGLNQVHSLVISELDQNEEILEQNLIPQGVCIKHVHISRTNVKEIAYDTFMPLRKCLVTLTIASSKIYFIPQKSLSGLLKLEFIDMASNHIQDIPSYSFYGLPLIKLNLKSNVIREISISAFSSLEYTLEELDLSENNLTIFPIATILKLKSIRTLHMAWNEIMFIPTVSYSESSSLEHLNLNYNNFDFISEDCLSYFPNLKSLSFHFNQIHNIHYKALTCLLDLISVDLSSNNLKTLHPKVFSNNKKIQSIDLSHNHLHHIHGTFCNLPALSEISLGNNNILEVPIDSFKNSTNITAIYLENNCINSLHQESIRHLVNLTKFELGYNFISEVPHNIINKNNLMLVINFNNNLINEIKNSTFQNLPVLEHINFSNNKLRKLFKSHFLSCQNLKILNFENNEIDFIELDAFVFLVNLEYINLQNNRLKELDNIFSNTFSQLHQLLLGFNNLFKINTSVLKANYKLNHISFVHNNIKTLSKINFENLYNLNTLDLSKNNILLIEGFTFQHLNSTRFLNLSGNMLNNITAQTFFGLHELEELDISFNNIHNLFTLSFKHLIKLRILNLSFNPLKHLNQNFFYRTLPLSSLFLDSCAIDLIENGTFDGMNNLKILSLKNNSMRSTDLDFLNISSLKHLILSDNFFPILHKKSFASLPLLKTLVLDHCGVENIEEEVFVNKKLEKISIQQNLLNMIPINLFSLNKKLTDINLSNNFLDFLPINNLKIFESVEVFDISDNLIQKIELSGFENMTKLQFMIFKRNEIKVITNKKKFALNDVILLDLSYNRLNFINKIILDSFPFIQNLNFSYNEFINFDFLRTPKKLNSPMISLDLSKNVANIWGVATKNTNTSFYAYLYELHLNNANVTLLDDSKFENFDRLVNLYMRSNKIRRLSISPFYKLVYLENLDISNNKITFLKSSNFRGLTNLKTLCLSNNNIESMESFDKDLRNLKVLDLSYNKLQNVLNDDLLSLKELTWLYLNDNNIKYISATAFENLNKITKLYIDNNKLQTLSINLLNSIELNLQNIYFQGNTFLCTCDKDNVWHWIQNHPKVIKYSSITCVDTESITNVCDKPIITQVNVDKHKDDSVAVSWHIRNRTAIKIIQILYYDENQDSEVKFKQVDKEEEFVLIDNLDKNKKYIICIAISTDDYTDGRLSESISSYRENDSNLTLIENSNVSIQNKISASDILVRFPLSECVSFDTLKRNISKLKSSKGYEFYFKLDRSMGLIVGCSLGVVVFFIMVTVLLYTKFKERKRISKSSDVLSEFNDYYSYQSKEDILENSTAASTDNILLGVLKK